KSDVHKSVENGRNGTYTHFSLSKCDSCHRLPSVRRTIETGNRFSQLNISDQFFDIAAEKPNRKNQQYGKQDVVYVLHTLFFFWWSLLFTKDRKLYISVWIFFQVCQEFIQGFGSSGQIIVEFPIIH